MVTPNENPRAEGGFIGTNECFGHCPYQRSPTLKCAWASFEVKIIPWATCYKKFTIAYPTLFIQFYIHGHTEGGGSCCTPLKKGPCSVQTASPIKELRSKWVPSCLNHSYRSGQRSSIDLKENLLRSLILNL